MCVCVSAFFGKVRWGRLWGEEDERRAISRSVKLGKTKFFTASTAQITGGVRRGEERSGGGQDNKFLPLGEATREKAKRRGHHARELEHCSSHKRGKGAER